MARERERRNPCRTTEDAEDEKASVLHATHAGYEGCVRAENREKSRHDERSSPVFREKCLGARQMIRIEEFRVGPSEESLPGGAADGIIHVVTDDRRGPKNDDRGEEIEATIESGETSDREEQRIARQEGRHDETRLRENDREQDHVDHGAVGRRPCCEVSREVLEDSEKLREDFQGSVLRQRVISCPSRANAHSTAGTLRPARRACSVKASRKSRVCRSASAILSSLAPGS